jgi:LysM repeat protein
MAKKKKIEDNVSTKEKVEVKAEKKAEPKPKKKYYVVKHYLETLGEVARKFDTTPEKIMKDNHLPNARIHQGQTLVIK